MGLDFPFKRIRDTMVKSFHLGNLPQGLKALAYRELGMEMQDFDDLVSPYSTEVVLQYYRAAYDLDWQKPEEQLVRDKDGHLKMYRPQSMRTKLKRFFTDYQKQQTETPIISINEDGDDEFPNGGSSKSVFEMWTKNWRDHQAEIEAACGEWPGKCITHVPFDKTIHYACRDADATLRLWPVLKAMERQARKKPQENWRDAI